MTTSLVARARVLTVLEDGQACLELLDAGACAGCHCGKLVEPEDRAIRLDLGPGSLVRRGEELAIAMPAGDLLRASAWLHGLPWLGLVAGSATGGLVGSGDISSLLGAGLGLAAALLALRHGRGYRDRLATSALRLTRTSCKG